ncbi:MAG: MarR family winged helix-turn-helix transcriptional regulator [Pseudomonadota bacterium]
MDQSVEFKKLMASVVLLERFVRDIYPSRQSSSVQPLQWSILRYLDRMPPDRCEVRWIAKFLGLTRAPVTRALATLHTRKFVTHDISPDDARNKTFKLTDQGRQQLEQDPIILAIDRIRTLPEDEREQFIRSVRTLALNTEGGGSENP